jgi:hypothetical protein
MHLHQVYNVEQHQVSLMAGWAWGEQFPSAAKRKLQELSSRSYYACCKEGRPNHKWSLKRGLGWFQSSKPLRRFLSFSARFSNSPLFLAVVISSPAHQKPDRHLEQGLTLIKPCQHLSNDKSMVDHHPSLSFLDGPTNTHHAR